jgi:hypothetical protein
MVCIGAGMLLLPPGCLTSGAGVCAAKDAGNAIRQVAANQAAGLRSADGLIASTFDALSAAPAAVAPKPTAPTVSPVVLTPVTRVVSTIAIHTIAQPDDAAPVAAPPQAVAAAPDTAVPVPLAALPEPVVAAPPEAAPVPAVMPKALAVAVHTVVAEVPAAAVAAPVALPAKSGQMVVGGGDGVSVHAGPSGSSARLFALAAGQKVTVIGSSEGWRNIVDAQGRKGWAYSDYLK